MTEDWDCIQPLIQDNLSFDVSRNSLDNGSDNDKYISRPTHEVEHSVCRATISSVREIIKKYEPNYVQERHSLASLRPNKFGNHNSPNIESINLNNGSYSNREYVSNQLNCEGHSEVTESLDELLAGENNYRSELQNSQVAVTKSYKSYKSSSPYPCNVSYRDKCTGSNSHSMNSKHSSRDDTLYQSKTTITKIASGVRITTDIFFDPHNDGAWYGSRIATDLPPSKILKEFQQKNGYGRS